MKYFLLLIALCSCSSTSTYSVDEDELAERYKSENLALKDYREGMVEVIRSDLESYNTNHNSVPSIHDPF